MNSLQEAVVLEFLDRLILGTRMNDGHNHYDDSLFDLALRAEKPIGDKLLAIYQQARDVRKVLHK